MLTTPTTQHYAELLYKYLSEPGISDTVRKSDWLLVLGCNDLSVAEHATKLWHQSVAPKILFSGGFGRYTRAEFKEAEAVLFAKHAIAQGVSESSIALETGSTNTQENIEHSLPMLCHNESNPINITLITKPILCRRVEATFARLSSLNFNMSCANNLALIRETGFTQASIHQMVGEIDRLKHYPNLGYCNSTLIPESILSAQSKLIALGFTQQLLKFS